MYNVLESLAVWTIGAISCPSYSIYLSSLLYIVQAGPATLVVIEPDSMYTPEK